MKTAIQQAIEQIEQKAKYENTHIAYGMEQAVDILKGLLPVEREQIEAPIKIIAPQLAFMMPLDAINLAQDYYLTTFENHKG